MIADFLLVQKIRNGDNQAGNQLVEKYYSSIYQYCYLHTHNQEYAEDMVQETFERFLSTNKRGRDQEDKELFVQHSREYYKE